MIQRSSRRIPCALAALVAGSAAATSHAALLIHYKLDETSGQTALDSASAGGAQNGTSAAATPQWQPAGGILGGAIRFSPTAQADVDENITFTAGTGAANNIVTAYPLTVSSWVRTTSTSNLRETFVYLGDQTAGDKYFQTSKDPSNANPPSRAVAAIRNTTFVGAAGGSAINDGEWHHVVGVYTSPTSRTLYVDGRQVAASTTSVAFPNTTRFSLGALMRNTPTDSFAGLLDDAGLWDEALSPVRVALLNGLGRFSGVALDDPSIPQVEGVFNAQSGTATAGSIQWEYAGDLPGTTIGDTGTVDGAPYIVLGAGGAGVRAVPEPGIATGLCFAAAGLAARRRRAPVI